MSKSFIPLAFIVLWIVPVGWVGLMRSNYPLYPAWIAPLFRVSGVFESAPEKWRLFFIEIQDTNTGNWRNIDERPLFAPTPLGNRTRFQSLMNVLVEEPKAQTSQLLSWIATRLPELGYATSSVKAIRITECRVPSQYFLANFSSTDIYQQTQKSELPLTIVATFYLSEPNGR